MTLPLLLALITIPVPAKTVRVTWLGHAAFELTTAEGTKLMIDPFLTGNPATPKDKANLAQYKPDAILVTHSHEDHAKDAVALAKKSGAPIIGAYEHVASMKVPQKQQSGGNVGGKIKIKEVTIHLVPAMHGSDPGGRPLGFILELGDGRSIYHTGDTWIFGDMALIQEIYHPNIILLQAGGGPYNQDPATAALAIKKYFKPDAIIPMHYGTWPILADEESVKKAFPGDARLKVMKPGDTLEL
jgi:L-ascorbate metabolism protein UlaG (beta-lactamase superfamily)